MAKSKKVNPHRVPCSKANYIKGQERAIRTLREEYHVQVTWKE